MAVKCTYCGGTCVDNGGGEYECEFCGATFSKNEMHATAAAKTPVETKNNADSGVDVFDSNVNGVLEIMAAGIKSAWAGSGYIVSTKGYAITNAHVAADADNNGRPCQKMVVRVCNREIPATVVALADDNAGLGQGVDLALIRLSAMPQGTIALTFDSFNNVRNGEKVFVIGNSLGDGTCITSGIVSDKRRILNGKELLMTDCAINCGNSGGPIFNEKGLVIGTICSSRLKADGGDAKGMNYAVPGDIVQQFIEQANRQLGLNI